MKKHGIVRTVSLVGGVVQILGPSNQRCAILFSPPTSSAYTVSTDSGVALGGGLNMQTTTPAILITKELFGDAVQRAWYAVGVGGVTAAFLETIDESSP